MVKDLRIDAGASSTVCRHINISDEACHIFVRLMFIIGGKRNVKIGVIRIGLSDSIKTRSIIPSHIY